MKPRLLLIDSSPAVQRLVEQASGPEGYDVVSFKEGVTALDAAKGLKPEIVIADYHLEGVAFSDFCEGLHRTEVLPDTPIISLISSSDRVDEKHLQTLGVKAFLKKPLQADDLMVIVKKLRQEPAEGSRGGASSSDARHTDRPQTAGAKHNGGSKSDEPLEGAMQNLSPQIVKSVTDQVHQAVLQMLPDMVAREVRTQADRLLRAELPAKIDEALAAEQTVKTIREAVQHGLQDVVRDLLEPAVRKHLPEVLKQQGDAIEKLIKETAETAALQHAHLAAEKIVQEIAQEMVKDVAREVVREIAPDVAETEIRKEIDRLTAAG